MICLHNSVSYCITHQLLVRRPLRVLWRRWTAAATMVRTRVTSCTWTTTKRSLYPSIRTDPTSRWPPASLGIQFTTYFVQLYFIPRLLYSLIYQSRKRGMLENDLLLSTFASKYLPGFDVDQTVQFDRLINKPSNDWDIYYWATEKKPTPVEYENEIMRMLRQHVLNREREERRMPDL